MDGILDKSYVHLEWVRKNEQIEHIMIENFLSDIVSKSLDLISNTSFCSYATWVCALFAYMRKRMNTKEYILGRILEK